MHVHILNNVWEQKLNDWDTNTLPYRGTQLSIKLCIGCGPDIVRKVDINLCTDACTHSKQGVGTQAGSLGHKHSNTQVHPTFHVTIHRWLS